MSEVIEGNRVRHPDVAYDRRDLDHRAVFGFLIALGCGIFIVLFLVFSAFARWGKSEYAGRQTTNPIMTSNEELKEIGGDPAVTFPKPRLQPDPAADLNKFRLSEEEELNSYGWVDRQGGRIHIPIERAIQILGSSWPNQPGAGAQPPLSRRASQPAAQPGGQTGGHP